MWRHHTELNKVERKFVDMERTAFQDYMYSKYPEMFRKFTAEHKEGTPITCAAFGLEIPHGWYHVLESMCRQLELIRMLTGVTIVFTQIKEKFGSGRFYYQLEKDEGIRLAVEDTDTAVRIAELIVEHHEEYTCYVCGELGTNTNHKVSTGGWMHDCSLEGFIKRWEKESGGQSRIDEARKNDMRRQLLDDTCEDMQYLTLDGRQKVYDLVHKLLDEQRVQRQVAAAEAKADAKKEEIHEEETGKEDQ